MGVGAADRAFRARGKGLGRRCVRRAAPRSTKPLLAPLLANRSMRDLRDEIAHGRCHADLRRVAVLAHQRRGAANHAIDVVHAHARAPIVAARRHAVGGDARAFGSPSYLPCLGRHRQAALWRPPDSARLVFGRHNVLVLLLPSARR